MRSDSHHSNYISIRPVTINSKNLQVVSEAEKQIQTKKHPEREEGNKGQNYNFAV